MEPKQRRKKIIIGVLAVAIVTIILGLGLGLGLQLEDCQKSGEQWECTRLRCGEKRLTQSNCHCTDDCISAGDCCTNYRSVCHEQCGISTPFMQAVFPSKTFPNHYTIATGLYAESHGLVDNSMYDPVFDASFSLSNAEKDNPRWYLGQPWLRLQEHERPDFYTLYLEEPDKSGHSYGPVSGGLIKGIQGVDKIIGQLMDGLKMLKLTECINIIIVADHGMEETSCARKEVLQDMIGDVRSLYVNEGPFGRCKKPNQKIKPYLKAHLPKRFHFANSRRIEDVTVMVEAKWLFERYPGSLTFCDGGTHGYDNDIYSMQAMFLSYGPKFLSHTEVEPFSNVELYNLMCDVLEIMPGENNGTHGSMNHLLRKPRFTPRHPAEQTGPGQCPLLTLIPGHELGCTCPALDGSNPNSRLNLTASEVSSTEKKHLPFGRPRLLQAGIDYCVLHHQGFVSGYSTANLMPIWSSYTVEKPASEDPLPGVIPDCLRADVRLDRKQSATCDEYNAASDIIAAFLYPPNLNKSADEQYDALTMSNVVPMYHPFKKIWDYFQNVLLRRYAMQFNGVNVVTGPVFDYNYDGRYDSADQIQEHVSGTQIPIPTHYFLVLTSCWNSSGRQEEMETVSFLIPHRPDNSESCSSSEPESQWVEDLLWFHQSRVRDVELITGLDFYQDSNRPIPELLRVKTRPTAAIFRKT
ncbi:hypothetical protein ACEWY4_023982 [Coilia grayii]|uniref:SMB domain-containing protein n=1 Tax=Coilia grayii TaxID=363190 RepID=A0ABD1IZ33_9TELE